MDKPFNYIEEANVTASNRFHGDKISAPHFAVALAEAINALKELDYIKKALFYGRDVPEKSKLYAPPCHNDDCRNIANGIDNLDAQRAELILHSIVGLATEAGELLELLNRVIFEGKTFDDINFMEENGDALWYMAIGLKQIGATFDDTQRRNIAKLRHRFPAMFTEYDANNRDLFGERKILEGEVGGSTKQRATINNWFRAGNVLIGNVSGHPLIGNEDGCRTSLIVKLDEAAGICETKNTIYTLGPKAVLPASIAGLDNAG
jgi:NTP pyrophosphatase (non-canonical NTP hydrolase)